MGDIVEARRGNKEKKRGELNERFPPDLYLGGEESAVQ